MATSVRPAVLEQIEQIAQADDPLFSTGEHSALVGAAADRILGYLSGTRVVTAVAGEPALVFDEELVSGLFVRLTAALRQAVVNTQYWAALEATNVALRRTRTELRTELRTCASLQAEQQERLELVERCIAAFHETLTSHGILAADSDEAHASLLTAAALAEAIEITRGILRDEFGQSSHVEVSRRDNHGESLIVLEAHYGAAAADEEASVLAAKHSRVLERYVRDVPKHSRQQLMFLRLVP